MYEYETEMKCRFGNFLIVYHFCFYIHGKGNRTNTIKIGPAKPKSCLGDNSTKSFISFEMLFATFIFYYHFSACYSLVTEML